MHDDEVVQDRQGVFFKHIGDSSSVEIARITAVSFISHRASRPPHLPEADRRHDREPGLPPSAVRRRPQRGGDLEPHRPGARME